MKIEILHCGWAQTSISIPFFGIETNPDEKVWSPVSAYLIEHPKGLVLIDTGFHTDIRTNQDAYLGPIKNVILEAELPEGAAIHEQLEQRGIKPSDIDFLVLSHLHSDHVSGLKLVKDAKKILVSDIEWNDALQINNPHLQSMWEGIDVETFRFLASPFGPEKLGFDLFEDETIIFVSTPGHTNGLASTIIRSKEKFVLLCSDVGYEKKSWEQMILPGKMTNPEKAKTSLSWVREMSLDDKCIEVIANHDGNVTPHSIRL
jgi:glyoxylase-like metal-dependent hydrolase (beta-lactamase superfamily II)